ncbi:hypothetical protein FGG08_004749 [Glutinoglossum americanum]|uniref:SET domain-containing protein n=1 Tax=Glutinoglossum americanum TaxID=1670608 RepID=A0A9P8I8K6_9PEZI|nr:hypothetical protein FGG08_004749 [Glutinoglossum americanum]
MPQSPHIWLAERNRLTDLLYESPYDLILYLDRARVYTRLGYPDLAAGDAYRALLLADEVRDETGEYHEEAALALSDHCDTDPGICGNGDATTDERLEQLLNEGTLKCYRVLSSNLSRCGCLKSAWDFCKRGLALFAEDTELSEERERILSCGKRLLREQSSDGGHVSRDDGDGDEGGDVHPNDLPDQGFARREVYPWNAYEPDRFSPESLDFLNKEMAKVAPKCEVKATFLPSLQDITTTDEEPSAPLPPRRQLGVFAKEDLEPGEIILRETSLLTVNNRLHDSFCDACSTRLPDISIAESPIAACPDCDDTFFCNAECLRRALESYHPAVCGRDVEAVGREVERKETTDALYLLLLGRAIAMAETKGCHPLELREVKYIWGDFVEGGGMPSVAADDSGDDAAAEEREGAFYASLPHTLPFTFPLNILLPLHLLLKMSLDPYTALRHHEPWIHNTLLSKFRGTASARLSSHDGTPEVSAVHPLWCLANHDCDPNVRWEWGGEIRFWVRERRVGGREGGVGKGEEVFGHYCDVGLGVKERRGWAVGSLGGLCMCERCKREEAEEARRELMG